METCWNCAGEGGFHECFDDSCECEDPQDSMVCAVCNGEGTIAGDERYSDDDYKIGELLN